MKRLLGLICLMAGLASASTLVQTSITDPQYWTAIQGAAGPATFLQDFFGYPLGSVVIQSFEIWPEAHEAGPPCWQISAWIDYKTPWSYDPSMDPPDPPGYPDPPDPPDPKPSAVTPEIPTGALLLVGVGLMILGGIRFRDPA